MKQCKLQFPEVIYSTNLRKHVAVLSQLLNLEKNEMGLLTQFMGHDIKIHRDYYRLPEDTLQLAKCSKIILLMEKGIMGDFARKSLSEVEISLEGMIFVVSYQCHIDIAHILGLLINWRGG